MLSELYMNGFFFFNGIKYSKEVMCFLSDINNFGPAKDDYSLSGHPMINCKEIQRLPENIAKSIYTSLPINIINSLSIPPIYWNSRNLGKGFYLWPHCDYVIQDYSTENSRIDIGPLLICLWITPDVYIGREFIYGKIIDDKLLRSTTPMPFGHPGLEVLGAIKPKTGMGVLIDRTNPIWWHGVTELISDDRIVTIGGFIDAG